LISFRKSFLRKRDEPEIQYNGKSYHLGTIYCRVDASRKWVKMSEFQILIHLLRYPSSINTRQSTIQRPNAPCLSVYTSHPTRSRLHRRQTPTCLLRSDPILNDKPTRSLSPPLPLAILLLPVKKQYIRFSSDCRLLIGWRALLGLYPLI
jgi:hypothetical protein